MFREFYAQVYVLTNQVVCEFILIFLSEQNIVTEAHTERKKGYREWRDRRRKNVKRERKDVFYQICSQEY